MNKRFIVLIMSLVGICHARDKGVVPGMGMPKLSMPTMLESSQLALPFGQETVTTKKKTLVNEALVVINAAEKQVLITMSDLRSSLEGTPRSLHDAVIEELMYQDALSLHQSISDEELERRLQALQKMNGDLTREQLKDIFEKSGYTMEEALEQMRRREMIDRVLDYRVRSSKKLTVTAEERESYWKAHPRIEEATVTLQQAFIPSTDSHEKVAQQLRIDLFPLPIEWGMPILLKKSELGADKLFILDKVPGEIVILDPAEGGFDAVKLVEKTDERVVPLDDAERGRIDRILKGERFQGVMREYEQYLLSHASMHFTHERDRKEIMGPQ